MADGIARRVTRLEEQHEAANERQSALETRQEVLETHIAAIRADIGTMSREHREDLKEIQSSLNEVVTNAMDLQPRWSAQALSDKSDTLQRTARVNGFLIGAVVSLLIGGLTLVLMAVTHGIL